MLGKVHLASDGVHGVVIEKLLSAAQPTAVDHHVVSGELLQTLQPAGVYQAAGLGRDMTSSSCIWPRNLGLGSRF